ncbi:hypothetical protein Tco_1432020 [Tanacetum coccineum]
MTPAQPGQLQQFMTLQLMPPAEAPNPILTEDGISDAPIPPATKPSPPSSGNSTSPSGQPPKVTMGILLSSFATVLVMFLIIRFD